MDDRERLAQNLTSPSPLRWVFTGDSITHGALHTYGWRDYTELFSERLRYELGRRRDIIIKTGISGWTIYQIAEDLDWNILQFNTHVVSVNVGMNDCVREGMSVDSFRATYRSVVEKVRSQCSSVLLLHTPNRSLATDGKDRGKKLSLYADAVRGLAQESGSILVDHFADREESEASGIMHSWIGRGCHPNEYGHRVMARLLLKELDMWDKNSETCRLFIPG